MNVAEKSMVGREKSAKLVKDVMDETIEQVYEDMRVSQNTLEHCLNERIDRTADVLRVEMAERDFSMRLHGMYLHAQNRLAVVEEYVTEETQAVSFVANAVEEGLRGCYDIKELTELLDKHNLQKAMRELFLVENWFTICTEFSRKVEYLSSWGDAVPFKAQFLTDKFMAEGFLTFFREVKHVAALQTSTAGMVKVVHEFEFRIRNHLNTMKHKHQHAILGFKFPRRQPTLYFFERPSSTSAQNSHSVKRTLKLGKNTNFTENICRRCIMDNTGFPLREGEEERYWCWEEQRGFEACLDLDGMWSDWRDGKQDKDGNWHDGVSNEDGCLRHIGGWGRGTTKKCYT